MITALGILLVAAHLAAVNFATVAPFVAVLLEWRSSRTSNEVLDRAARWSAAHTLTAIVVAAPLGILAFFAAEANASERYWSALTTYRHRVEMGVAELGVSVVLFFAYWWPWDWWKSRRIWHRMIGVFAATNLAYHFPVLFTIVGYTSTRAEILTDPPTFISLLREPQVGAALLHFYLASVAVTGVAIAAHAVSPWENSHVPRSASINLCMASARMALVPTVLQLGAGFYLLLQLPETSRAALMGGDGWSTILFIASLASAFLLMQKLFAVSLGETTSTAVRKAMVWMALTIVLMVASRNMSRFAAITADAGETEHSGFSVVARSPTPLLHLPQDAYVDCPVTRRPSRRTARNDDAPRGNI